MPRRTLLAGLTIAGFWALGCSAPPVTAEPLASAQEAIVNGVASTASQNFVVLILRQVSPTEAYECSGTLLTPSLVLTARHCVSQITDMAFSCDSKGNGTSGGAVGADVAASTLEIYTGTTRPALTARPAATGSKI